MQHHHPFAAFDPLSDHPGPSSSSGTPASSSNSKSKSNHRQSLSSDYGAFASAPSHSASHTLRQDDLLGSYDDDHVSSPLPKRLDSSTTLEDRDVAFDLLTGVSSDTRPHPRNSGHTPRQISSAFPPPLHISLPPRPIDISPDYIPPRRTPRRLSTTFSAFTPGSPPLVSDVGSDIIFHPTYQPDAEDAMTEIRRVQSATSRTTPLSSDHQIPAAPQSPPHSKLLDTLATTTKMASKFRTALKQAAYVPPIVDHPSAILEHDPSLSTPLPTGITHKTPFASMDQLAGSYTAPTGAPGFNFRASSSQLHSQGEDDDNWGHIKLLGRRPNTSSVLTVDTADKLRRQLPPRQRLSSSWTLLFSLDQHGASLNTLYRLADVYSAAHRNAGNVLIVQDGTGARFGVFMNESIAKREGTYYGSGESFLYKVLPSSDIKPFRWTGRNQYFALCETDFVSFGGGGGVYGLLLDNTFSRNSSATCPAYDNEILCTTTNRKSTSAVSFDCVGLEVWGTG